MNPRIFKKLCKRSADIMERSGYVNGLIKVQQHGWDYECPEITMSYKWERKSYQGKKYGRNWLLLTLDGTAGFGATSGYYEPEWQDSDALSILRSAVMGSFVVWSECGRIPKSNAPKTLKHSSRHAIAYAEAEFIKQIDENI